MQTARKLLIILVIWNLGWVLACRPKPPETVSLRIAAASDLDPALREVAARFEESSHIVVKLNFGSTGTLVRQIEQGAPVDVFLAANVNFVDQLSRQNLVLSHSITIYGQGRLVMWCRADAPLPVSSLEDLANPAIKRVALANPEHAPYGQAALQALTTAGLYPKIQNKLILSDNVSQALQFAQTGNVDVAFVALSLVQNKKEGRLVLVDQSLYPPLNQALCILARSKYESQARMFAAFLTSPDGQEILRKYGFVTSDKVAG